VTYKYQELTDATGVPRFPVYVGLRRDGGGATTATAAPAAPARKKKAAGSVPAAPPSATATPPRPERGRRLELGEGSAGKFWEVCVTGSEMTTRSGKSGNQGRKTRKRFADATAARKAADKLIAAKTGQGYVEK